MSVNPNPAPAPLKDMVECFHINCGVGDCTIVCWLKENKDQANKKEWTLHRCVLIDGGKTAGGDNADKITKMLSEGLPAMYHCPANERGGCNVPAGTPDRAYLDAVVITHWDSDHYQGVLDFMAKNFSKGDDKTPAKYTFAKYSKDDTPLTVLYVPTATGDPKAQDGGKDKVSKVGRGSPNLFVGSYDATGSIRLRSHWRSLVGTNIFQNERPKSLVPDKQPNDDPSELALSKEFPALSYVVDQHDKATNSKQVPDGEDHLGVKDQAAVIPWEGLGANEPGLFIIRAERRGYSVVGAPTVVTMMTRTAVDGDTLEANPTTDAGDGPVAHHPPSIPDGISIPHPLPMVIPKPTPVKTSAAAATNAASIICVLAWQGEVDGRTYVSHYLGGDATWDQEDLAVKWLAQKRDPAATSTDKKCNKDPMEIDFAKLSHHGATNSTPASLLDCLQPRHIVISAARQHSHPRWELIIFLHAWIRQMAANGKNRANSVFATRYPYYLLLLEDPNATGPKKYHYDGTLRFSALAILPSPSDKPQAGIGDFQKRVQDQWQASNVPTTPGGLAHGTAVVAASDPNPITAFADWLRDVNPGAEAILQKICEYAGQGWEACWAKDLTLSSLQSSAPTALPVSTNSDDTLGLDFIRIRIEKSKPFIPTAHRFDKAWDLGIPRSALPIPTGAGSTSDAQTIPDSPQKDSIAPSGNPAAASVVDVKKGGVWRLRSGGPGGIDERNIISQPRKAKAEGESRRRNADAKAKANYLKQLNSDPKYITLKFATTDNDDAYLFEPDDEVYADNEDDDGIGDDDDGKDTSGKDSDGDFEPGSDDEPPEPQERYNTRSKTKPVNKPLSTKSQFLSKPSSSSAVAKQIVSASSTVDQKTTTSIATSAFNFSTKTSAAAAALPAKYLIGSADRIQVVDKAFDYELADGKSPQVEFFNLLPYGSLAFNDVPSGINAELAIHAADDLSSWFKIAIGAQRLVLTRSSMAVNHVSPSPIWNAFEVDVGLTGDDPPTTVAFTTNTLESVFGETSPNQTGWFAESQTLILGLKTASSSPTISLIALLQYLGITTNVTEILASFSPRLSLQAANGSRNAIWYQPGGQNSVTIRLQLEPTAADVTKLESCLVNLGLSGVAISSVNFVGKKTVTRMNAQTGIIPTSGADIVLRFKIMKKDSPSATGWNTAIGFGNGLFSFCTKPEGDWNENVLWAAGMFGDEAKADVAAAIKWFASILHAKELPSIQMIRFSGRKSGIASSEIAILLPVSFGQQPTSTNKPVAFLLSFQYVKGRGISLQAAIYGKPPSTLNPTSYPETYLPDYEAFNTLPDLSSKYDSVIHLTNFVPSSPGAIQSWPGQWDPLVRNVIMEISRDQLSFQGTLSMKPANEDPKTDTVLTFGSLSLVLLYKPIIKSFSVTVSGQIVLSPYSLPGTSASKEEVSFSLSYLSEEERKQQAQGTATPSAPLVPVTSTTRTWTLVATISVIRFDCLVDFVPAEDQSAASALARHLWLTNLDLDYSYTSDGSAGYFSFVGCVVFGPAYLDLNFKRYREQGDTSWSWSFEAALATFPARDKDAKPYTLNKLLKAVTGDPTVVVPDFVDVELEGSISFALQRTKSKDLVSAIQVTLQKFTIDFIQIVEKNAPNTNASGNGNAGSSDDPSKQPADPVVKRCLLVSIHDLPWDKVPHIPIVGEIKQPFSELQYLFVHGGKGLTNAELGEINSIPGFKQLPTDNSAGSSTSDARAIALAAGSHFVIPSQSSSTNVSAALPLLNYRFGGVPRKNTEKPVTGQPAPSPVVADDPPPKTKLVKLNKSQGPLSIANLGLRYAANTLHIILDAKVALGPVEFALKGFEITLSFPSGISLQNMTSTHVGLHLSGLALAFDRPPVVIAGLFVDLSDPNKDELKYAGGAVLGIEPYAFVAAGSYADWKPLGATERIKSVFIFAELAGPLVELEFGEINDITAGFGYNSALRLPTVADIQSFPFIRNVFVDGQDPIQLLEDLTGTGNSNAGWITNQQGPLWMAAGLGVRAFQVLDVKAVVVLEFNPYASLGIFADATLALPSSGPGKPPVREESFLYAELGIASSIDFHAGVMQLAAQLMPSSFILNPSCQLSGGFAMSYWFGSNPHAGDWVISIGGYHPAYIKPSHYPSVERVAITWSMGGGVNVLGEAYFAITPKMCMGGGLLRATLDAGPLSAYFDAHADFLVAYQPFHFTASVGIEVGVRFTLDLWIVTIHISVDIGASLDLWGPPVGGNVYVDFYVFGFTIPIGDGRQEPKPITLDAFYKLLQQQPGDPDSVAQTTGHDHVLSVKNGLATHDGKAGTKATKSESTVDWIIRRTGTTFTVQSKFAIGKVELSLSGKNPSSRATCSTAIYSNPMHSEEITSLMSITLSGNKLEPDRLWTWTPVIKHVPRALWSQYDASQTTDARLDGTGDLYVDLCMGIDVTSPQSKFSSDTYYPIDAQAAMNEPVFAKTDNVNVSINKHSITSKDAPNVVSGPAQSHHCFEPSLPPLATRDEDVKRLKESWNKYTTPQMSLNLAAEIAAWSTAMRWDTNTPVSTAQPAHMIDNLDSCFPVLPMVVAN